MNRWLLALAAAVLASGCSTSPATPLEPVDHIARMKTAQLQSDAQLARLERESLTLPDDRELFTNAAQAAWRYVDRHYQPATGLTAPLGNYQFATVWDIGSMLAATFSARELGLIDEGLYRARVGRLLQTLESLPLYDGKVFNKSYDTRTGAMVHYERGLTGRGLGWSAIDLGRLLIWLKIVGASDAGFEARAKAIVARNDFSRVVHSGYLWGESVRQSYQEGRIGYEQYAAEGFALWGMRADKALNIRENALPVDVMGQRLAADYRRWDRLTSEPFVLMGLELGWDREVADLTRRLLVAQERRYQKSGAVTMASEDSVDVAPHFFFYYCVYTNGRDFGIDVQDRRVTVDDPRWVSAKAALAFHALMPTRYTDLVVQRLEGARGSEGWASGVYERSGETTGNRNVNTAAVILTAALYNDRGAPLLPPARRLLSEN